MKPPNHGLRVKVTDNFVAYRGYLLYAPEGFDGEWCLGLGLREYHGTVTPLLRGDRITLLP